MVIKIKSPAQVEIMREGGRVSAMAIEAVLSAARVGTSLAKLDRIAENVILKAGGESAFKRVPGYNFATCLNLNEGVVHGLPSQRGLEEGDLLSVDLGVYYKGLNTDTAWTILIGDKDISERRRGKKVPEPKNHSVRGKLREGSYIAPVMEARAEQGTHKEKAAFLEVGERALQVSVEQCRAGNRVGDISAAMEKVLRGAGYSPVETLVGHGVGEELHEEPQIPCLATRNKGPKLKEGMALAIEVIYTAGDPDLEVLSDGWTIATADGSLAGSFEHTVAVTAEGPIVLTGRD